MGVYSVSADNDPGTGGTDAWIQTLTPGANRSINLIDWSASYADTGAAFAARFRCVRSSGGTFTGAGTIEKRNTRTGAADATSEISGTVNPTITGNPILVMGMVGSTVLTPYRRWMPPNPRYPIVAPAAGEEIGLTCLTFTLTFSRYMCWAESVVERAYTVSMRRKSRTRGYQQYGDEARFFGLSTAPKSFPGADVRTCLQPADWPTAVFDPGGTFLNLLNEVPPAGGATDPGWFGGGWW